MGGKDDMDEGREEMAEISQGDLRYYDVKGRDVSCVWVHECGVFGFEMKRG